MDIGRVKSVRKRYGKRIVFSIAKYKNSGDKDFHVALMVEGKNKFNKPIIITLDLDEVKPEYTTKVVMDLINSKNYERGLDVNSVLVSEKGYSKPKQRGDE